MFIEEACTSFKNCNIIIVTDFGNALLCFVYVLLYMYMWYEKVEN